MQHNLSLSERTLCISNVFWGEAYRRAFLEACLPSLLWPKNIAALERTHQNLLLIVTTDEDWLLLNESTIFRRATQHYRIERLCLPQDQSAGKFARCAAGYREAALFAASRNAIALHLSPDLMISDGTLGALHDRREAGAAVVVMPVWRTELESFQAQLTVAEARGDGPMGGRRLAEICINSVHGFERDRYWSGLEFRDDIGSLWWSVPGERGWLMHVIGGVPYLDHSRITDHDPRGLGSLPFDAYHAMFRPIGGSVVMADDSSDIFVASFTPKAEELDHKICNRWQYRLPVVRGFARGLAFRSHVRTMLKTGRNEVGLRGLVQPYRVHIDPLTAAWESTANDASHVIAKYVGDLMPDDAKPAGAISRATGIMLDLITALILPSVFVSRLNRTVRAYFYVFRNFRTDRVLRQRILRRLGWS